MKKYSITFFIAFSLMFLVISCNKNEREKSTSTIRDLNPEIEKKVDSVLSLMRINEKIGQLVQYSGKWNVTGPTSSKKDQYKLEKIKKGEVGSMLNVTSVKTVRNIQEINMKHSRLKIPLIFAFDVIHGYKTIFPIPLGESASWDLDIIKQSAFGCCERKCCFWVELDICPNDRCF